MRPATRRIIGLLVGMLVAAYAAPTTAGSPMKTVVACQAKVARAAERAVAERARALALCLGDGTRCAIARAGSQPTTSRLARAAARCASRPASDTLGTEGIGWEALAPVCPTLALTSVGDVVTCLGSALTCVADVSMLDVVPEAAMTLAARGISIDRTCLAPPVCGNGVREADETCDDGNVVAGDGCDASCQVEVPATCGDGVLDDGEECDDGAGNSDVLPDHCRTTCLDPFCGDGIVDPDDAEECEPPGTSTCDEDCFVVEFVAAPATSVAAETSAACVNALAGAARRVASKVQRRVDDCVLALARCSLVDDDPSDQCLARAERRCAASARRRASVPGRLALHLTDRCDEAAAALAARLESAACAAEAATSRAVPRADELMLTELFELDGDDAFPCVVDLGDLE